VAGYIVPRRSRGRKDEEEEKEEEDDDDEKVEEEKTRKTRRRTSTRRLYIDSKFDFDAADTADCVTFSALISQSASHGGSPSFRSFDPA